jgi:hypothetical protein
MSNRTLTKASAVVARSPSFAESLAAAGFKVPDQKKICWMKRASALGLAWGTPRVLIALCEQIARAEKFQVIPLEEYLRYRDYHHGAPIPDPVLAHIRLVQGNFPGVNTRIHALESDDPFVEFELDGEKVITAGWKRLHARFKVYLPR